MGLARAARVLGPTRLFPPGSPQVLALLRAVWPRVVGEELARRTEVLSLQNGTLRVAVPDGRWRLALHRMQPRILAGLRSAAGELAPRRLGFSERRDVTPPAEALHPAPPPAVAPQVPEARAAAAAAIPDPELRAAFLDVAARYLVRFKTDAP